MAKSKIKIGLVCPYNINKHGGVLEVVLHLYKGLKDKGHDVKIITPMPRGHHIDLADMTDMADDIIFMGTSTDFRSISSTTTQVSSTDDIAKIDTVLSARSSIFYTFMNPGCRCLVDSCYSAQLHLILLPFTLKYQRLLLLVRS